MLTPEMDPIKCMGTGTGNSQVPGTDIPDNGCNDKSHYHGKVVVNIAVGKRFNGKKIDNANGNSNSSDIYPDKIPDPRPDNSSPGL